MNGVTITRKVTSATTHSRVGDAFAIALFGAIALLLLPFLGLSMIGSWLRDQLVTPNVATGSAATQWHPIDTGSGLLLRYEYIQAATISAAAEGYFEHQPLLCYQADPELPFFTGYFTDLKVARVDGVFVQKIHFDAELREVVAMPLYFFSFQTHEAEELLDLLDYTVEAKGNPDNFMLEAQGEHENLHIHLVRAK